MNTTTPNKENEELRADSRLPQISLREWFAGQALAGLLADGVPWRDAAEMALPVADRLLAERDKK